MRVLYITPYVPSRIRVRPYNLIKKLSRRHEVTLVSLVQSDHDKNALQEMLDVCKTVRPVRLSKLQSITNCGKRLLTGMPLQAAYTYQPELNRMVDNLIAKQEFDVVHVEHVRGAHFASHIDSLPKVYDSVDCITLLLRQYLKVKKNPISWCVALEEWAKMRVYEAMISERFDKVVITSQHDRNALENLLWDRIKKRLKTADKSQFARQRARDMAEWRETKQLIELSQDQRLEALMPQGGKVSVLPNGVDHEYFSPMDIAEEPDTVVFSGKMSYCANSTAVKHFYDDIFPIVLNKRPGTRFIIAGADPPPNVRKLADHPMVTVTGYVDDMRPYLAKASVAICPITVGVGIQNKVLEAMAMGKPVVATSKACLALDAENGKELLLATGSEEFAQKVIELLGSAAKRRYIGENAARYVRENHDWESISDRLAGIYDEAAEVFGAKGTYAAI